MTKVALSLLALALAGLMLPASAAEPVTLASAPPVVPPAAPADTGAPPDNAAAYCRNIANPAADARYARQVDALNALRKDIEDRLDALDKKRAEYQDWVKKREDFMARADQSVVAIYSQMRPDAAAQQIAVMDADAAAAILSKLAARTASAILNEMDAATAAHLTNVMAGLPAARPGTEAKS
jgi:flagellar motility protein MotE (MotC chaperone)